MESVVIDRSSSYARTKFGSVDGGLLISKSFNATRPSFLGRNNNSSLNANSKSSLVHQPPLLPLPLPLPFPSTGTRTAFSQRRRYKKPRPTTTTTTTTTTMTTTGAKNSSSCSKEPNNNEPLVIDKPKRMEVVAASPLVYMCSVSPPPSSVPMPRFSIPRGKAAAATATTTTAATATTAVTTADGNSGHVDVCATDGLRRLLRI